MMLPAERFPRLEITSPFDLREWLQANHSQVEAVWLVTWMRSVPEHYVDRWEVLDELLCFGWIDGIRRKLDGTRTMQLITPRRQLAWAASYKLRVERLEAEGRMREPGRAAVAQAKAQGMWDASYAVDALIVPEDLCSALHNNSPADVWFEGFAPSYRRNVLRWLASAKKTETRAKRIAKLTLLSAANQKLPQM
jgi:uncharacterized protein YdeI (YjbR/CyaY-like superfamily)